MDPHEREIFSALSIFPPIFIRLDGRAFHRLSRELRLSKPFDPVFHGSMTAVAQQLLTGSGLEPAFAYTFSDEVSLYFTTLPFSGRIEKLDSVAAAFAASALTIQLGLTTPLSFDARVIPATPEFAVEYLTWRQNEAWRNHINGYCQQALIEEGLSSRAAATRLRGVSAAAMHEMMFARGVNLAETPAWQRRGTLVCRETVIKEGYNPVTGEVVETTRKTPRVLDDLPLFSTPEGERLIASLTAGL
ncbi:tRNA 5'-guanylyltransferase [Methanoculleus sp. FWC-SCC1]|uniref:tRNA(His) guanylyltransferase n=1 Tax=Methanoculleus frigidifontis TaxID=2584085 RepID=A0ABT8M9A7_9EURY|nr:tRNA(His) guanylyltransferase Thg1 family protein [Methanoculleus sp. FWC-SCC1]MDN7024518.1 tRNA 5'-guanylyltransferase [Methanoculleus sp. FWC-SCC1]